MGTTLTIVPDDVVRRFVFVPDGYEQRRPENEYETLVRAHDVLQDEARWTQGAEHRGLNGPDDPFCGNWRACAIGAVGLVSIGLIDLRARATEDEVDALHPYCAWSYGVSTSYPDADDPEYKYVLMYRRSIALLDGVAGVKNKRGVVSLNDRDTSWTAKDQTRKDVLEVFTHAAKIARIYTNDHPNSWPL